MIKASLAVALSAISCTSMAALYDRGNGIIYDSTQNISYLQNANLAASETFGISGILADGNMDWATAKNWIAAMNGANYKGYSDWRLPSANLIGNDNLSFDGSTDYGANNQRSEIGNLYFQLSNKSYYDTLGNAQSGYGVQNTTFIDANTSFLVSFSNFGSVTYAEAENMGSLSHWAFLAAVGLQMDEPDAVPMYHVLAVRNGDITAVPLPSAIWFFGSGIFVLFRSDRRNK